MSVQFFSGLFGRFTNIKNYGSVDILCMLGDIGNPFDKSTRDFLQYCSKEWKKIYWIGGQTEFNGRRGDIPVSMNEIEHQIKYICPPNCIFLNNSINDIKLNNRNTIFFGTSLWSGKETGLYHLPSGDSTPKPIMPWELETIASYNRRWLTGVNEEIAEHYPNTSRICLSYSQPDERLVGVIDPHIWLFGKNTDNKYIHYDYRVHSNYENRCKVTCCHVLK